MIPYNPCGAIVDWGRYRYDTDCRFFRDSETTCKIRWYPALPDAIALPGEHEIYQSVWDRENYELYVNEGVGEVPDATMKINHMTAIPGADGTHRCGTPAMFEGGALWSEAGDFPIRADGLPVCCPGRVPPGLLWGGRQPGPPPRGLLWGGRALELVAHTTPDCHVAGVAHLADTSTRLGLVLAPAYPTDTTAFAWLTEPGEGNRHVSYESGPPGTVTVQALLYPSFCLVEETLYSGPSDEPFELDLTPASNRQIGILIDSSPDPFTVAVMTVTPLP